MNANAPFQVTVHPFRPGYAAYETGSIGRKNAIVFIGGLGDGPHSVQYLRTVAKHLEEAKNLSYSLFEFRLRSSFSGFGTGSIADDVADISALVKYLRSIGKDKIVLFGHSTGCQDCAEYTNYTKHGSSPVDGFILQAPISDREAFKLEFPDTDRSVQIAEQMIAEGKADHIAPKEVIPPSLGPAVSAYRLRSLLAKGGDEDYFSSDLDDATVKKIWSRFDKPVLVLHSEKDENVPRSVDQRKLNKIYQEAGAQVSSLSDLIPNTGHTVRRDSAREWLGGRIVKFLETLA
ncbi:esterase lipase superfamily [Trichoderma arundinaceum]|uniref:Esterase lipase superfamily n=1 Tax=Trichoderma arundinaceum TaxID=490622 RepID=A0A395NFZ7_TRIAR|nr:esterase lipase superfamily [Trichoderma arundinaceum]